MQRNLVEQATESGYYEVIVRFKADEGDTVNHLAAIISSIAVYMVDNVEVEIDFLESDK